MGAPKSGVPPPAATVAAPQLPANCRCRRLICSPDEALDSDLGDEDRELQLPVKARAHPRSNLNTTGAIPMSPVHRAVVPNLRFLSWNCDDAGPGARTIGLRRRPRSTLAGIEQAPAPPSAANQGSGPFGYVAAGPAAKARPASGETQGSSGLRSASMSSLR